MNKTVRKPVKVFACHAKSGKLAKNYPCRSFFACAVYGLSLIKENSFEKTVHVTHPLLIGTFFIRTMVLSENVCFISFRKTKIKRYFWGLGVNDNVFIYTVVLQLQSTTEKIILLVLL